MPTPPPSPPISLSPPSARERLARRMAPSTHSSPPPVPSPLLPSSGCPTQIQTLRIASTQALYEVQGSFQQSSPTEGEGNYGFSQHIDAERETRGVEGWYGIGDLRLIWIAHQETIQIVKEEAYASREAWAHAIGLSQAVHSELQTHREQAELLALRGQHRRARQPGSDARAPDHQEATRDGDSHI
ncbi:hypothetical protein Tco_0010010 [Tanacetum coccineum]